MYPSIFRRYLSTAIDYAAVMFLLYAFSRSPLYDRNATESPMWPLALFFVYEPLLTAFACTLGQLVMNIRVRRLSDGRPPTLYAALLRLAVKLLLGILSVLFIPSQKQRRGLHDLASGTIVVSASRAQTVPPNTSLERTREG